jgi:hypothetical protein
MNQLYMIFICFTVTTFTIDGMEKLSLAHRVCSTSLTVQEIQILKNQNLLRKVDSLGSYFFLKKKVTLCIDMILMQKLA